MIITLPNDLESLVHATVRDGQFATIDDAMAEAARLLLRELAQNSSPARPTIDASQPPFGFIGALRDDAELLDQAVEHALNVREERAWRWPRGRNVSDAED